MSETSENCGDPGRGCRRLQQARRRRRRPHSSPVACAPQRPHRSHHRPSSRTRGQRTGDGSLVEFRSVVDAVRCAIEVQDGMLERNAGLPPERRIEFRVGIHLGDVVEESDGDLMGDGVDIAARTRGDRSTRRYLPLRGRLSSGERETRHGGRRPWPDATQEHRTADPGLFA